MKKTKRALFSSVVALILCFSMLLGTTFAWFTDSVESGKNQIVAGNLDIELYWSDDAATWHRVDEKTNIFKENAKWEPGYTEVVYLKIVNEGSLALKYQLGINVAGETGSVNVLGEEFKLSQHIRFGVAAGEKQFANRNAAVEAVDATATALNQAYTSDVAKLASKDEQIVTLVVYMPTSVGNEANHAKGAPIPTINLGIRLQATQVADEMDSFGPDYDENATFPELKPGSITADISGKVQGSVLTEAVAMDSEDGAISAVVPAGTKVSGNSLILSVSELSATGSNITLQENEILRPMDVHIEGVAQDNQEPILVTVKEAMMKGLNIGNYTLYHVEQSGVKVMTAGALDQHNGFVYDPATGDVTVALATFSEVALVADTENAWEGEFDYSWYDASKTELTIANADQLAAFGAIVGGMNGQTQDSFAGKTVKLIADINLGDKESENNPDIIFYPIGYWNSEGTYEKTGTAISSGFYAFKGTFDGNGNTISNFYQNTWEMKGDHNWYSPEEQYYRDGMGLFGRVYGGTVKNLTVKNFSSDGEIATTGVIAAYADGATFENIAIFDCNPRVYNIGNGGIVGCVGWYAKEANLKTTFKNITVDNSNKISALWGSYDVACGGIVGQYYPTSGQTSAGTPKNAGIDFENCHISAQMDVYNDVCANYQYYAYRYTGMLIGSVRENVTIDGKSYPKMDGISASGCTVHFGTWNDYYYCEIIDNTTASYTHDYQMSRLTEIKAIDGTTITYLDGTTGTVPASGRANYVIVDYTKGHGTENATCYHFKDGAVWTHDMGGIQTGIDENGDNQDDLKEDKQHIYLEFNNLVTGYGWGVTSKGLEDFEGTVVLDNVYNGELVDKFTKNEALSGDFLYRVGNGNAFPIGKLFQAIGDQYPIIASGVHVSVRSLADGVTMTGTFKNNATDWKQSTLHITGGTGPAVLTIQDYNSCKPFELIVEVVDATNLTGATGTTTGGNFVLLCDVNTTSYVNYWNCTVYGNGFTYSLNGAPTAYNSKQGHGIIITKNATLDNLVIVGDVYNSYGAYTNQDDYNAAVDVLGETTIQNCYISGCAAPVLARASVTITNTTLYGGTVANLLIKSGVVTLENVTTANYDDGRVLVGMGIVIHSDATAATKLVLNGTLTQYNFISEAKTPSDSNAKMLYNAMFDASCSKYHFGTSPNRYVNAGIISMTANFNKANIVDNANTGYSGSNVTVNSVNGYVYTQLNTSGSVNNNYDRDNDSNIATTQGPVAPSYSFDYTNKNYVAKIDGSNDYCYEENGIVYISMDEGDTINWDTSILTATKLGQTLPYTVSMNGTDYTGKSIVFNTAGSYEVVYTYTDDSNYGVDEEGKIITYSKTYTKTVYITVATVKAAWKNAEIKVNNTAMSGIYVMSGDYDYSYKMKFLDCITITDYDEAGNASTVGLSEDIKSVSFVDKNGANPGKFDANEGTITITYNDGKILTVKIGAWSGSGPSTKTCSVKTDDGVYLITDGASNAANTGVTWKITGYTYTGNNGAIVENNTTITFTWDTNSEGYNSKSSGGCFTADTLITLADGTQKRVDELSFGDKVLAWDFFTGTYVEKEISLLVNHGENLYRVANLQFSDGTVLRIIADHGVFDYELNKFVYITVDNMDEYVGHRFVQYAADGCYNVVTLTNAFETEEYTSAWSITSAGTSNAFASGLLTVAPPEDFYNWIEMDDKLHYDVEQFQKDVQTYGLYTYEDFKDYVTYEQFVDWNGAYLKIAVEKGYFTFEYILELIELYKGWMPNG